MAKILVVDDEQSIRALVQFRLEHAGHEVLEASDGESALEVLGREIPELIVLDITMPGMSGLKVLESVRQKEETKAIKVILLSANGREQDIQEGMAAGANAYITKPFRAQELLQTILDVINA